MHNGWPSTLCLTAAILLAIAAMTRATREGWAAATYPLVGALGFAAAALLL